MMVMRALFHIFDQVFRSIAANKLRESKRCASDLELLRPSL